MIAPLHSFRRVSFSFFRERRMLFRAAQEAPRGERPEEWRKEMANALRGVAEILRSIRDERDVRKAVVGFLDAEESYADRNQQLAHEVRDGFQGLDPSVELPADLDDPSALIPSAVNAGYLSQKGVRSFRRQGPPERSRSPERAPKTRPRRFTPPREAVKEEGSAEALGERYRWALENHFPTGEKMLERRGIGVKQSGDGYRFFFLNPSRPFTPSPHKRYGRYLVIGNRAIGEGLTSAEKAAQERYESLRSIRSSSSSYGGSDRGVEARREYNPETRTWISEEEARRRGLRDRQPTYNEQLADAHRRRIGQVDGYLDSKDRERTEIAESDIRLAGENYDYIVRWLKKNEHQDWYNENKDAIKLRLRAKAFGEEYERVKSMDRLFKKTLANNLWKKSCALTQFLDTVRVALTKRYPDQVTWAPDSKTGTTRSISKEPSLPPPRERVVSDGDRWKHLVSNAKAVLTRGDDRGVLRDKLAQCVQAPDTAGQKGLHRELNSWFCSKSSPDHALPPLTLEGFVELAKRLGIIRDERELRVPPHPEA